MTTEQAAELASFTNGTRVILARSPFAERIGKRGIVVKRIKSRRVVRFLVENARSKHDTYDAFPENLDKEAQ